MQKVTKACGDTQWKAAASTGSKFAKKEETGCMLATCRHSLLLKGLDMERGEMFVYPYLLQVITFTQHSMCFLCCKKQHFFNY